MARIAAKMSTEASPFQAQNQSNRVFSGLHQGRRSLGSRRLDLLAPEKCILWFRCSS